MKTVKQLLVEVKRTPDRAIKLVNYITKRQGHKDYYHHDSQYDSFDRDNIERAVTKYQIKNNHTKDQMRLGSIDDRLSKEFKSAEVKKLPLNKISTTQNTVETPGVVKKLKEPDNDPIKVIKHKGLHYVVNGHHRYAAARLSGDTHINAHVVSIR